MKRKYSENKVPRTIFFAVTRLFGRLISDKSVTRVRLESSKNPVTSHTEAFSLNNVHFPQVLRVKCDTATVI